MQHFPPSNISEHVNATILCSQMIKLYLECAKYSTPKVLYTYLRLDPTSLYIHICVHHLIQELMANMV